MTELKKITEIKENENVKIEGIAMEVFEAQDLVKKSGERIGMQEILVVDDTGESIILKLWGKDINTIKLNDKIRAECFVGKFKDNLYLSKGKYGKIEKIK
jgi:hypothetical protein